MPKKTLPRVAAIEAGPQPLTLRVYWTHGGENLVDVSGMVDTFRVYAPLRCDPDVFAKVKVGEDGAIK